MKKKLILALALLTAFSLMAGCGKKEEEAEETFTITEKIPENDPNVAPQQTEEQQTEEAEEPAEPAAEDEAPAEGMVRSLLTNEWIDADLADQRPLAFMYPINKEAQPQYGLDAIDIFYEIMEEDGMSRQMGIMQDWKGIERIGNVRSIRDYFVYAALEYDPIIVHFGGPELYVKDILTRSDVENINGVGGVMGGDYGAFWRDNPNNVANLASEHTAYTNSEKLVAACEQAGFQLNHRDVYEPDHFKFTHKNAKNTLSQYDSAVPAKDIYLAEAYPTTKPELKYNEEDHLYYREIYGQPQVDGTTGNQLAFENVIIQWTYYKVRDAKGYLAFRMHDVTHDGFFITEGKMIHVTWKKEGDYKPTKYYDDNGEEITFNQGKTMIFVVQQDKPITVDGNVINPSIIE
ncbi:MAG: DUF3048 domain-containing protein [Lachnospiraceae bacterium]|nr:DUF3048 domain-containing protein [Lachnospiraceae bacterium]